MACQQCKDLGSVVKTFSDGSFQIIDCGCQKKTKTYIDTWTLALVEVTEVVNGVMSILETYETGNKYRRIVNEFLFNEHLKEGRLVKNESA